MRRLLIFIAAAGAIATAGAAAPGDRQREAAAKLAKATAGLTPGRPVACIDTRRGRGQITAAGPKLIYRVNRQLVYVSDTRGGCERVGRGDTLVTRQFNSRLCRGDIAQAVDFRSRIPSGTCVLGPFVPYTRR